MADIQHSQPHTTLHQEVLFFIWGVKVPHKVELPMLISLPTSLASLITPYSIGINIIICSSLNDTCNKNFGTNCVSDLPEIDNFRQSFILRNVQPGDVVKSYCKEIFNLLIGFWMYPTLW